MWKLCQFDLESRRHHWNTASLWVPVKCETKRNKSKRNLPHFVSVNFVLLRFISFRFRFAFYRYPHRWDIQRRKTNNYQLGKSVTWQALGWHNLSLGDNLSYHTLTRLKIVYCIMLPGVNKFWTTSLAQG